MALPSHPNELSTLAMIEAIDATAQRRHAKASMTSTSTASLSSSSSKELGVSSASSKEEAKRGSRKRKASARTSTPCLQAVDTCKPAPIIRRFSADKSQFKDIVQQYTGFHCPPPCPTPLDLHNSNILVAAVAQSLRTLDTISAYLLLHSSHENNILLNEINKSKNLTFLQALKHKQDSFKGHMASSKFGGLDFKSASPSRIDIPKPLFSSAIQTAPKDIDMPMLRAQELPPSMPSMHKSQQIAELEHVLLKDNTQDNFFSLAWVLLKQMASQQTPLAL